MHTHVLFNFIYLLIFGCTVKYVGSEFHEQLLNPCPLQWERGVLTTELPGKSKYLRSFPSWLITACWICLPVLYSRTLLFICLTYDSLHWLMPHSVLPAPWPYHSYPFVMNALCLVAQLCLTLWNPVDGSLPGSSPWGILQARILEWVALPSFRGFSQPRDRTQVSRHCRQILYHLSHQLSPRILEWVAYPFSSRSSQPRSWTGVSCIVGGFFTSWATREAFFFFPLSMKSDIYVSSFFCCIIGFILLALCWFITVTPKPSGLWQR